MSLSRSWRKNKLLRVLSFFTLPAAVLLFDLIVNNWIFSFYETFPLIDIPMHFVGGAAIAYTFILFLRFFEEEKMVEIKNKFVFIFLVVCAVSFVAVLWEIWEFSIVTYFGANWFISLQDTIGDLVVGICGGFFVGVISKI